MCTESVGCMDSRGTILVADDCNHVRELIEAHLRALGYEALAAVNGAECVTIMAALLAVRTPPSMVILDVRMPMLNGLKAAAQMREQGFKGPMIAFTATASNLGREHSKLAGIDAYFNKSVMEKTLLEALLNVYGSKAA